MKRRIPNQPHVRARAVLRRIEHVQRPMGVEVGVFTGRMSLELLRGNAALYLILVDNWAAAESQPETYRATEDFHASLSAARQQSYHHTTRRHVQPYLNRCRVVAQSSIAAAAVLEPRSCDFVFLDADHSYEGVCADIDAWWPILRPGGWLCGHDYDGFLWRTDPATGKDVKRYFGVTRAVNTMAEQRGWQVELDKDYTWFVRKMET